MNAPQRRGRRRWLGAALSNAVWCYLIWVLLTWTATAEQQLVGAAIAAGAGLGLAPLGDTRGIWYFLTPRRLAAVAVLTGTSVAAVVRANLSLARRVLTPRLPLRSGMTVVPTEYRDPAGLAAVGILTSLVVDNQIVDLDGAVGQLQYHAVSVPPGTARQKREAINGPTERRLSPLLSESPTLAGPTVSGQPMAGPTREEERE